jgi:hypothetical protein
MEHPPLFDPGLHEMQESEINNHFLSNFPTSKTRPSLIAGLKAFMAALRKVGVDFEVWLDGSFCTNKVDPNDIDMVVFADVDSLNKLDQNSQIFVQGLLDRANAKRQYGCDVLFAPAGDFNLRSYWRGWYGFDRNEQPKGMAKIMVTP